MAVEAIGGTTNLGKENNITVSSKSESGSLLLVAMPFVTSSDARSAPSSVLVTVAMPFAPSSVLAPSSTARSY